MLLLGLANVAGLDVDNPETAVDKRKNRTNILQ